MYILKTANIVNNGEIPVAFRFNFKKQIKVYNEEKLDKH